MIFPIALQLYSVRDEMEKNVENTLRKVKSLGYDGVEFAGLYGFTPAQIKKLVEEIGLTPVSAHVSFSELTTDLKGTVGAYAEIGCRYIAIPYLAPEFQPDGERFHEVIEESKKIGQEVNAAGMTLLYHNHDFEFKKIDGEYALDLLYRNVSAELLQTELDTCWVNVGGENPAAYLRKYSGRAPVVHLKDFVMPGKMSDKASDKTEDKASDKTEEVSEFEHRPLGLGVQDFTAILDAARDAGTKWVVVEHDSTALGKTSMEFAEMSIQYLRSL